VFFALGTIVSLTPAHYLGIRQTGEFARDGHLEVVGYRAAYDLTKLLETPDQPDSRVLIWSPLAGLSVIAWTDLPHQGGGIQNPEAPPRVLNHLTPTEADLLRYPTTAGLLLLSEDPADMTRGLVALRRIGLHPLVRRLGAWADGRLHYALVDLSARPR
jgi:hypothetical protein